MIDAEKIYNKFTSGELTITIENEELAKKLYELSGGDEGRAEYEFIENALGKQIPKRPTPIYFDNKLMCGECVICGHRIATVRYCPKCGQAIDWSEE